MSDLIPARLEGGPFDGQNGHILTMPLHIAVRPCPGCGCGRPLHMSIHQPPSPVPEGRVVYRLYGFDMNGDVVYRYGVEPWPEDAMDARHRIEVLA